MAPPLEKISALKLYQQILILAVVVLLVVLGFCVHGLSTHVADS